MPPGGPRQPPHEHAQCGEGAAETREQDQVETGERQPTAGAAARAARAGAADGPLAPSASTEHSCGLYAWQVELGLAAAA